MRGDRSALDPGTKRPSPKPAMIFKNDRSPAYRKAEPAARTMREPERPASPAPTDHGRVDDDQQPRRNHRSRARVGRR